MTLKPGISPVAIEQGTSTADWFSAVGTLGTLVVALVLLDRDIYDRYRAADQARRAQAAMVAVTKAAGGATSWSGQPGSAWEGQYDVVVSNRSEDVISEIKVRVWLTAADDDPTGTIAMQDFTRDIDRIDGHAETRLTFEVTLPDTSSNAAAAHTAHSSLKFTDAADRRWIRDERHRLKEIRQRG